MVPEAPQEQTEAGTVAKGDGWYVVNARDAQWWHREGRPALCHVEAEIDFAQLGINICVLWPGQAMAMYHWEADQEDFLVVSGEAVLIIEGEERPLRAWDFVHCPPNAAHTMVGAGDGPCVVIATGARDKSVDNPDWGAYPVDETAARYGASVQTATTEPEEAYSHLRRRSATTYQEGWLPDL